MTQTHETEADKQARINRAAPDMLEALRDTMNEINAMKPTPSLVAVALKARAAIAKAGASHE